MAAAGDSIRLYDTATGEERLCIDRKARDLHFTDGGKTLTGAVKGAIYRWDTATGKALTPEAAGDSIVEQILVTPDGSRVVTRGQNGDAHIWNATTGEHLRHIPVPAQRGLALSPDGQVSSVAGRGSDGEGSGSRLNLYDLATDRLDERFPGFKGDAQELAFALDGKTIVSVDHGNSTVRVWDVAAGKELRLVPRGSGERESEVAPCLVGGAFAGRRDVGGNVPAGGRYDGDSRNLLRPALRRGDRDRAARVARPPLLRQSAGVFPGRETARHRQPRPLALPPATAQATGQSGVRLGRDDRQAPRRGCRTVCPSERWSRRFHPTGGRSRWPAELILGVLPTLRPTKARSFSTRRRRGRSGPSSAAVRGG